VRRETTPGRPSSIAPREGVIHLSKLIRYAFPASIVGGLLIPASSFATGTVVTPASATTGAQDIANTAADTASQFGLLAAGVVVAFIGVYAVYRMGWAGLGLVGKVVGRFGR
jgi:hypothetical protein